MNGDVLVDGKNYRGFVLSAKRMLLDMSVQCLIDNCNLIKLHIDRCDEKGYYYDVI